MPAASNSGASDDSACRVSADQSTAADPAAGAARASVSALTSLTRWSMKVTCCSSPSTKESSAAKTPSRTPIRRPFMMVSGVRMSCASAAERSRRSSSAARSASVMRAKSACSARISAPAAGCSASAATRSPAATRRAARASASMGEATRDAARQASNAVSSAAPTPSAVTTE